MTDFEDHPTANVCAPNSTPSPTIPVSFDSSGGGTVGATNTAWTEFASPTGSFKSRVVIVSGTVSLTGTSTSITLVVRFEYRTCDSLTTLCLTNNVTMTVTGPSVGLHPTASATVTVAGVSTAIPTPLSCNTVIRSQIHGQTASARLDLHFV